MTFKQVPGATRALLVGIGVGLVSLVTGLSASSFLKQKVHRLERQCMNDAFLDAPDPAKKISRERLSLKLKTIPEKDQEPYLQALKKAGYYWDASKPSEGFQTPPEDMICTADQLKPLQYEHMPVGIQGAIIATAQKAEDVEAKCLMLAGLFPLILGIPWVWYFLLARVREFREAALGR